MHTANKLRALVRRIDKHLVTATVYVMLAWLIPYGVAMVFNLAGVQLATPAWVGIYFSFTIFLSVLLMGASVAAMCIDFYLHSVADPEPQTIHPAPPIYPRQARTVDPSGYVYLLRAHDDLYKIGHTKHPHNRLHTFEVRLPFEVTYEHLIPCENRLIAESTLHKRYARARVHGEWFRLTEAQVAEIKAIERM